MGKGTYNDDTRVRDPVADSGAYATVASRPARRDPDAELGSIIGDRYVLKTHLGTGRYGEIYVAVDRTLSDPQMRLEHLVALHLLHTDVARQTRLLQKLETSYHEPHLWSHPNVVKVRGFGCDRGRYFLVTELLEGVTLRAFLDATPNELPSEEETLAVLRGVGDALAYAHGKGAIHGDLRPAKIFITSNQTVKVLDLLPATSARTRAFFVEDAAAGLAAPDSRDDVYGLACIAYELWDGNHPFGGRSPLEASNARLEPAPITRLDVQRWDALARGLALRREQRTPSVAALLAALGVARREPARPASATVASAPAPSTPARRQDDDMPIIGDFSGRTDVGSPRAAPPLAEFRRAAVQTGESWRLDPRDVDRYAERARRSRRGGPLGTVAGLAALVLVAALGVAAYFNYEPLRSAVDEWLAVARTTAGDAQGIRAPQTPGQEETIVVEPPVVVATPDLPAEPEVPDVRASVTAVPAPAAPAPMEPGALLPEPPAVVVEVRPVAPPPEPPAPETFAFATPTVTVSESQAAAALVVRRSGGNLGASSVVWRTSDGTAKAGSDYADLGSVVERFAPGEATGTIHVPIVGDATREGPESFYVTLYGGERDGPELARVEVVIEDDD